MSQATPRTLTRYRMLAAAVLGVVAVLVGLLTFGNLNRNLVYYLEPAEAVTQRVEYADGRRFQLGGLVEEGTVTPTADGVRFVVTSASGHGGTTIPVEHRGAPAQLFGGGIGVVLEGSWRGSEFVSDTMKVKHDENYRPPEDEAP
ncbi:cytochrome c maturation protein CcmE [Pseudonocardia kunmingensis]|uniref:Cytochrome c-type biogenesis protein CcmE n=1 Tax=Pseudonocardia kunmingensis TaxID=630975 RepID=A0A543DKM3_9PSEU|nr:cytochrome c maturation protein CcmE [Pseudonocardia kunmingensis]TQM09878.1 cytochrome c-type biogenesis protein CcmE [Pseudonocardia kunmingensis]